MTQSILHHPRMHALFAGVAVLAAAASWPAHAQGTSHSGRTLVAAAAAGAVPGDKSPSTNGSPGRPSTSPGAKEDPVPASGAQTVLNKEKARRENATVRPWETKPEGTDAQAGGATRSPGGAAGKASSTGSTDHRGMGGSGAAAGGGGSMDDRARTK